MTVSSETTALIEPIPSVPSCASLTIMEKEKPDNSGMAAQGNAEKKPAWNRLSNGDTVIKPVMGASSWPSLSETTKAAPSANKPSSSSSSASILSQQSGFLAEIERMGETFEEETIDQISTEQVDASSGNAAQTSEQTQNQYQRNSHKNQNGNNHPNQGHGGRRNQEHVSLHRTFNRSSGSSQPPRGTSRSVRPPHVQPFYIQYMHVHQNLYPVVYHAPPMMMLNPHCMPIIEPPPMLSQVQEAPLKTRILNQVHFYFSEENLARDKFLRKHMDDEGFVHIQFIAGFNMLKALTTNIQLILDSLRGSNVVEVKGYEIRNRRNWKKFLMPRDLRVTFNPSPEYEMGSKLQNMSLEKEASEIGSSSSKQKADTPPSNLS